MTCSRCHGLMVVETVEPPVRAWPLRLWRCVSCGARLDYVIARNRREQREVEEQRHWKEIIWEEVKDLVAVTR